MGEFCYDGVLYCRDSTVGGFCWGSALLSLSSWEQDKRLQHTLGIKTQLRTVVGVSGSVGVFSYGRLQRSAHGVGAVLGAWLNVIHLQKQAPCWG